MKRSIRFYDSLKVKYTIDIELKDGGAFSVSGSSAHGGGQCQDSIKPANVHQRKLVDLWNRWYLNDLKAGTPAQMAALETKEFAAFMAKTKQEYYPAACAFLKKKRLYSVPDPRPEHKGKKYLYGHAWLKEELPADLWQQITRICDAIERANGEPVDSNENDFLKNTGTELKVEFLKYGFYFPEDKEKRDIYRITLTRGARSYSFNFGQSINASGRFWKYGNHLCGVANGWKSKDGTMRAPIEPGEYGAWSKNPNFAAPSAYDILTTITKNDPGTFENFCSDYGYSVDSRTAEKTYRAVMDEWQHISMLYNDVEIAQLQDIN